MYFFAEPKCYLLDSLNAPPTSEMYTMNEGQLDPGGIGYVENCFIILV